MNDMSRRSGKWFGRRNGKGYIYNTIINRRFVRERRERKLTLLYARLREFLPKYSQDATNTDLSDNESCSSSPSSFVEANKVSERIIRLSGSKHVIVLPSFKCMVYREDLELLKIRFVASESDTSLPFALLGLLHHLNLQLIYANSFSCENTAYHTLHVQILKPWEMNMGDISRKLCIAMDKSVQ